MPHHIILFPSISFFIYVVEAKFNGYKPITLGLKGRFNMYIKVFALLMLNRAPRSKKKKKKKIVRFTGRKAHRNFKNVVKCIAKSIK